MAFNPDEFLAQAAQQQGGGGFDPDAFLQQAGGQNLYNTQEKADIDWEDRAVVKNFGGKDGGIQYLQEKYPDMEFAKDNGEIFARKRGETGQYKALDPDTGFFSTDFLQDAGDVLYDIGAGAVEGAAATAAAGASIFGTPAASLAAGAAAGSAAGGGMEALRQKIGEHLGARTEDDFSASDIGTSAALGALGPLAFGAGAGTKGLASVAKNAIGKKIVPQMADATSGIASKHYRTLIERGDEIAKMTDDDVTNLALDTFGQIEDGIDGLKKELGEDFNALKGSSRIVNTAPVLNTLNREIIKLESDLLRGQGKKHTKPLLDELNQLKDALYGRYGKDGKKVGWYDPTEMDAGQAFELKDTLSDFSSWTKRISELDPKVAREVTNMARQEYGTINKKFAQVFEKHPELKQKYADLVEASEELNKYKSGRGVKASFKDKAMGAMKDLDSTAARKLFKNQSLRKVAKRAGVDIDGNADLIQAHLALKNPSLFPVSGTSTSTSRSMLGSSLGMAGAGKLGPAGQALSAAGGLLGLGPRAWKKYITTSQKLGRFSRKQFDKIPGSSPQKWQTFLELLNKQDDEEARK